MIANGVDHSPRHLLQHKDSWFGTYCRYNGAGMAKQDSVDVIQRDTARAFPEFDSGAATITGRIRRVNLHLDRAAEDLLRTFNITGASLDVLAALFAAGPPYQLTPTDLYRGHMMSSAGVTARLDVVERAGLAARAREPRDR